MPTTDQKLHGAVVLSDEDVRAIVELLTSSMKDKANYQHYPWVNEVPTEENFDFIIVANLEHVSMTIKHYAQHEMPVPAVIHFARRAQLQDTDYATQFPGVTIYPIEYSILDTAGETLKYDAFYNTIRKLEQLKKES